MKLQDLIIGLLVGLVGGWLMLYAFQPTYEAFGVANDYSQFTSGPGNFTAPMSSMIDLGNSTYSIFSSLTMQQNSIFGSVLLWANLLIGGPLKALNIIFIQLPKTLINFFAGILVNLGLAGSVGGIQNFAVGIVTAVFVIIIVFVGWKIFFGGEG